MPELYLIEVSYHISIILNAIMLGSATFLLLTFFDSSSACLPGGLAAVIYTDALQTVIMTIGAVILAVIGG